MSITRHKDFSAITGFDTHRLAKCRLACAEIGTGGTEIATRCRAIVASACETVIETALAFITETFACASAATLRLSKSAAVIILVAAATRLALATCVSVCKTAAVRTKSTGTATAATPKITVAVVIATATAVTGTKIGVGTRVREALLRLHPGNGLALELLMAVELNIHDLAAITEFGKSHRNAVTTRPTGTPNAVRVVFRLHGQTKIEHVSHGGHVNTACGHIGRHQNLYLTLAQRHQTAIAQALAQCAMQRDGGEAFLLQIIGQAITLDLGAGENNGLVDGGVAQPVVQQFALVLRVVGPEQLLADVGVLFLRRVNLQFLRITHHAGGKLLNARRKRGAEHHGLLALNGQLIDFSQVIGETEIKHAVSFVNDQELNLVELDLHGPLQIEQTPRCSHHQIGILQLGNLQLVRHAANDVGHAQATAMLHQIDRIVGDLLRQFTCRANNQGTRCGWREMTWIGGVLALGALGRCFTPGCGVGHGLLKIRLFFGFGLRHLHQQGVQHGQQKGGRLAATGLTRHHQVGKTSGFISRTVPLHGNGDGFQLDRGGLGKTQVFHGMNQFGSQPQGQKAVRCLCNGLNSFCRRSDFNQVDNALRRLGCDIGKVFDKRCIARRLNSVSHEFTHTRAPQGTRLLRQWLKNINHQTEPALTHEEFNQRGGPS